MFTLKLYTHGGSRRILEVESFHIGEGQLGGWFEITAYFAKPADDPDNARRFDVGASPYEPAGGRWDYAFIENAAGKTTEKLVPGPSPSKVDRHGFPLGCSDHKPPMTMREIVEAEG